MIHTKSSNKLLHKEREKQREGEGQSTHSVRREVSGLNRPGSNDSSPRLYASLHILTSYTQMPDTHSHSHA